MLQVIGIIIFVELFHNFIQNVFRNRLIRRFFIDYVKLKKVLIESLPKPSFIFI